MMSSLERAPPPARAPLLLLLLLGASASASASAASAGAVNGAAPSPSPSPPRRSLLQQQPQPQPQQAQPEPRSSTSSSSQSSQNQNDIDGRTLPLAGAPASSGGRGRSSAEGGFTADGFGFGFGGAGPINLGPGGFGPQIYETIFGSNLNTGFVSAASQATSNLAGPDAGGPLRDALFAALPAGVRGALGADVVSLVGYDAGDRLLGQLGTFGSSAAVGELVPAGCIGPIFTVSLSSGVCTVDGGGEDDDDEEGGGKGGDGKKGAPPVAEAADGGGFSKKHGHRDEPSSTPLPPSRSPVTCTPPVASFVATPLTCNLPYRSAATLSGPSLGGVAFPLAAARSLDLLGAPLAFGAGAALNVTRLYLGYSGATRRLLNDLGVYRWYNYAGQVAAAELLRIQAAIIAGATPALRATSSGRITTPYVGLPGGTARPGGIGGLLGVGALSQSVTVPRAFNASEVGGEGQEAGAPPPAAAAAVAAHAAARELMQREADALPPVLRSAAAALAGAAAATQDGSAAAAGAREVAEAADELGRRIAARLGVDVGGARGGGAFGAGSGVALLSALARGDLAGVRRALGRSPLHQRQRQQEEEQNQTRAADAAAAEAEAGGGGGASAAAAARGSDGEEEDALPPYMTAPEQQALIMEGGDKPAGTANPYRRHVAAATADAGRAGTGKRLARSTAADAAADAAAAAAAGTGAPPPSPSPSLQPSPVESAQSALDPLLVSSEDVGADVIRAIMALSASPSLSSEAGAAAEPAPAAPDSEAPAGDLLTSEDGQMLDLAEVVAAATRRAEEQGVGGGMSGEEEGAGSGSDAAAAGDRRRRRQRRRR
jgi:hypothetical protein